MKKMLILIVIGLIAISSVFAIKNELDSSVDVDALVDEIDYSLKLFYDTQELTVNSPFAINSNQWSINDSTIVTKTEAFLLQAIGGNIFAPQLVTVTISPTVFIGTLETNDTYATEIIPEIRGIDGRIILDSIIDTGTSVTTIDVELPAGFQEDDVNLLSFIFQWRGNSALPSGRYVSNITITYKVV
jgi:hypothetical protein